MVRMTELKAGQVLKRAIYSRFGQRLLAPGVTLTPELVRALEARGGGLYVEEPSGSLPRPAGEIRSHYQRVVERLRSEGEARSADQRRAQRLSRLRREAEEMVAARLPRWDGAPRRVEPSPDSVALSDAAMAGFGRIESLLAMREERLEAVESLVDRLVEGGTPERQRVLASEAEDMVEELADQVSRHAPVFPHVIAADAADGFEIEASRRLSAQMLATATLSASMAARLGWSHADVITAGLAGLLADVGMALVDENVWLSDRPLDDVARNRVRRHPAWSVALLEEMRGLPLAVRIAVHQHHEREDGSGYPRGLRGTAIHDVARVVAVADAYAAGVSERSYRSRRTRFSVVRSLIEDAKRGRVWRSAVRALVQTVGLFPVGSFVRLSDGGIGQVMAAGGSARAARPVVRLWRRDGSGGLAPAEVIDLCSARWSDVRIAGEVELRSAERRGFAALAA